MLENHTSGKLITKLFYSALGTTVLENVVRRNGKKPSHNKFFYNYLEPLTQADHNSWISQCLHVFFMLLSCFGCGEKTLVTCNVQKPRLFIFLFLTKEQKWKKVIKEKFHAIFFNMTWCIEMKYNTTFMYDTYTYDTYNYDIK